jgi:hypothetical protein
LPKRAVLVNQRLPMWIARFSAFKEASFTAFAQIALVF